MIVACLAHLAQTVGKATAAGTPIAGARTPLGDAIAVIGAIPAGIDDEDLATEMLGHWYESQHGIRGRLAEIRVPTVELHRDGAVRVRAMGAPIVVQTLRRRIEITVGTAEQDGRQREAARGAQPMAELPVVQAAGNDGTVRSGRNSQGPIPRPEDLAHIGRGSGTQSDIGLEIEARLAGAALQNERRGALAALHLRLVCPGTGEMQHALDR